MKIFCCDDDKTVGEQIESYLREYFEKNDFPQPEYKYFDSGEKILESEQDADIVFLDVEMPGESGICVGAELKERKPNIIIFIVTSYPDYLDDAMRFHVFRYLSKPIDKNRLFRNMKDALFQYNTFSSKIAIETRKGVEVVRTSDIIYIEAKDRRVMVYTVKEVYESVNNMQFWLEHLASGCFFQTHRSYIVSMEHVSGFDKTLVYLCGGKYAAYLTRRKYVQFKNAYILYLESMR